MPRSKRHVTHVPSPQDELTTETGFFATLEWGLLADEHFASHGAIHRALVEFIDLWYNHERLHSSLGIKPQQDSSRIGIARREQPKPSVHQIG